MQFSAHVLDNFLGPKLSSLTACGAPDVPELPAHHMTLVLNQALSKTYKEPIKVLLLNFIRLLQSATNEYRGGREHLLKYLSHLPDHVEGRTGRKPRDR